MVEEHFTDEDLVELADVLAFAGAPLDGGEITLCFEDLLAEHGAALARELASAGVARPPVPATSPDGPATPPGGRDSYPGRVS